MKGNKIIIRLNYVKITNLTKNANLEIVVNLLMVKWSLEIREKIISGIKPNFVNNIFNKIFALMDIDANICINSLIIKKFLILILNLLMNNNQYRIDIKLNYV